MQLIQLSLSFQIHYSKPLYNLEHPAQKARWTYIYMYIIVPLL
jgi:hypothetical protein